MPKFAKRLVCAQSIDEKGTATIRKKEIRNENFWHRRQL